MRLLTIGTFDTPHIGHASFLKKCEQYASQVIVGINSDAFVLKYRGEAPLFNYAERMTLFRRMGYECYPNESAGRELIEKVMPDVVAIGSDWAKKDYYAQIDVTQDWLDAHNISMLYIPYAAGISSTEIKRRLAL